MTISVLMSGGAEGADLTFGKYADLTKHSVIHYSFGKHRTDAPKETVIVLSEDELKRADPKLKIANKTLKRKIPFATYTKNLLRRNAFQVELSKSVYAVATIKGNIVQGGTGWACQMYLDSLNYFDPVKLYVFDQEKEKWYEWVRLSGFVEMTNKPPKPDGIYTGIGTRKLNSAGETAIKELYED